MLNAYVSHLHLCNKPHPNFVGDLKQHLVSNSAGQLLACAQLGNSLLVLLVVTHWLQLSGSLTGTRWSKMFPLTVWGVIWNDWDVWDSLFTWSSILQEVRWDFFTWCLRVPRWQKQKLQGSWTLVWNSHNLTPTTSVPQHSIGQITRSAHIQGGK